MNINSTKKIILESIFIETSFINKTISNYLTLKPNLNIFENLGSNNKTIKEQSYFYLFNRNEVRVRIYNPTKFNQVKNILIENSKKLGAISVKETLDTSNELSLVWPPITQEKIKEVQTGLKQAEVNLLEKLRNKRHKCKADLLSDATKEEKKILEKTIESAFSDEKKKIISFIEKAKKEL